MKHKHKIKLARSTQTEGERRSGAPIFETVAWEKRKEANAIKVRKQWEAGRFGKKWKKLKGGRK